MLEPNYNNKIHYYRYKIFDEDVVSLTSSQLMPNGRLSRASVESVRGSTDNMLLDSPRLVQNEFMCHFFFFSLNHTNIISVEANLVSLLNLPRLFNKDICEITKILDIQV